MTGGTRCTGKCCNVLLAEDADLRIRAPESFLQEMSRSAGKSGGDPRLPAAGTWLTREFQGQSISVEVLEKGFRYQEDIYKSLSAYYPSDELHPYIRIVA